jgi:release factor glutamine methyltransferase
VPLSHWLTLAEERLLRAGISTARLEAQILASHGLKKSRAWVLAHPEAEIEEASLDVLLCRREAREPLAYVLGSREFFGRSFQVDRRVLVPRQETEILAEAALELLPEEASLSVLDLCTGSGCVGITLALERPSWELTLSDRSKGALEVAQKNALGLGAAVALAESDLLENLGVFDAVACNPPYVAAGAALEPEVGAWEPPEALFAGESGLEFFQRLADESKAHLAPDGVLLTEIGDGQAAAVRTLFFERGWSPSGCWRDLDGRERVLAFRP